MRNELKIGDRVKVIALKETLPLRASEHAGHEGVIIEISDAMVPTYYLVSFGEDDNAAYLLNEISKVG